jgi:Transcriptional regulators
MPNSYPKKANILKFATKVSLECMTYTGVGYNDPEYKILANIMDDDMCDVAMHLKLDTPRKIEDIAKRCKKTVEETQIQIDKLVEAGIVRGYTTEDGGLGYSYPIWVPVSWKAFCPTRKMLKSILLLQRALKSIHAAVLRFWYLSSTEVWHSCELCRL